MSGELQAGDAILSMWALAKSIHVSVITVQKAYEDLQRDGFIKTTVGRGSYHKLWRVFIHNGTIRCR